MSAERVVLCKENCIRDRRKQLGMSQEKLANAVGTSASMISHLERGNRSTTIGWLRKIAEILEVEPAHLLVKADNSEQLSIDEKSLLKCFRSSTSEQKQQILKIVEIISSAK